MLFVKRGIDQPGKGGNVRDRESNLVRKIFILMPVKPLFHQGVIR